MTDLTGKIAVVTGGSRGIGRAIVARLAGAGAQVVATYNRAKDEADSVAAATGATLIQADLAAADGAARLADALPGEIDILVNNAGIATFTAWGTLDATLIDREFAVNVRAPLLLTQALDARLRDDGRVIFLSSIVARRAFGDGAIAAYAATKGAVDTLVGHLAGHFGKRQITVNAVAPGAIDTDMSAWLKDDGGEAQAHAMQALARVGQPEDIADVIAFLASTDSRWITGQTLQVGGGTLL